MSVSLTKQEIDFIFNTLMPLNLGKIKEGDYKSKLQLFLNAHNPEKLTSLNTKLEERNITKEQHYEKAFEDTVHCFLLEQRFNKQKRYVSKSIINNFKTDIFYLFKYNSFYHYKRYTISVQLYMLLGHINSTFKTLEEHERDERLSFGTAFMTSSYRTGLDAPLNDVRKQLDTKKPFSFVTTIEKERLKVSRFLIKTFRNHTNIANLFITLNAMHSYNKLKIKYTEGEEAGFKQVFAYLNGLKTSKEEIVRSFMIKAYFPYYQKETINKTKLAKMVHNMAQSFFPEIVYIREIKKKDINEKPMRSYTVGLSSKAFDYKLYIKTALNENVIYAYDHKKEYTWLIKGSVNDALKLIKKMYLDEGHDEIVNNPLFDRAIKKLVKSPIYPL